MCVCVYYRRISHPTTNRHTRCIHTWGATSCPDKTENASHQPCGTLTLQSANHSTVKLLPLSTPHAESSTCSSKTRQRRSRTQEMVLHSLSSPATSIRQQHAQDEQKQLISLIQRNPDQVSSVAEAAGLPILHKLSVDDMIQLEKLTFIPFNTMRLTRSFQLTSSLHPTIGATSKKASGRDDTRLWSEINCDGDWWKWRDNIICTCIQCKQCSQQSSTTAVQHHPIDTIQQNAIEYHIPSDTSRQKWRHYEVMHPVIGLCWRQLRSASYPSGLLWRHVRIMYAGIMFTLLNCTPPVCMWR